MFAENVDESDKENARSQAVGARENRWSVDVLYLPVYIIIYYI